MAIICPTVLAEEAHAYREQMERIAPLAKRIQIDLTDGDFAPSKTVDIEQIWWPESVQADIHLMYRQPSSHLDQLIALKPRMIIVHIEAEVSFPEIAAKLHHNDIQAGLALLAETPVESVESVLSMCDHILIFSGTLGHFGGKADLDLLKKAIQIKSLKPSIEIGWDGGINAENAKALANGGIDVLNVGGFIQKAENPAAAYAKLKGVVEGNN
jgi:ribulose-phosphate 3-epimerase